MPMPQLITNLFDTTGFPPRWQCGSGWTESLGWLHIVSDVLIWGAYVAVPIVLSYFIVKKRRDLPFSRIFILFGAFIFACGFGHLIEAIIFWQPVYRLAGVVKFWTALVSWATVFALIPITPRALAMRSPDELEREIQERKRAEEQLRQARDELELRVQERTAELQRKNLELEQIVYVVSHDLKSPLVTMRGFVGVMKEDLAAGEIDQLQDSLDRVERASGRMAGLIEDLLQLSRVGRIACHPEEVDVVNVVSGLGEELAPRLDEAGASLQIQADLPQARADRQRLTQVFENLLTNAIKYGCERPDSRIVVGGEQVNGAVRYFVRDFGEGIAPKYHEKIFGLFERLHTDREGTGVGLAIVSRIMEVHGGRVWVESQVGAGATFWIELPTESRPGAPSPTVAGADAVQLV